MKNIYFKLLLFFGLLWTLTSCLKEVENPFDKNKQEIADYIKTDTVNSYQADPSGMYYFVNSNNTGKKADTTGFLVKFYYKISDLTGYTHLEIKEASGKYNSLIYTGSLGSIFTIPISKLSEGQSGTFLLPSNMAFAGNTVGTIPPYTSLKLEIKVIDVLDQKEQIAQMKSAYGFIEDSLTVTSSSLIYQPIKKDTGAAVKDLRSVVINYTGKLGYPFYKDDGNKGTIFDPIFDQADSASFVISDGFYIDGFLEALKLMKVGEKAKFILPYGIAYGNNGKSPSIPPYANLFFEIEVLSGKK